MTATALRLGVFGAEALRPRLAEEVAAGLAKSGSRNVGRATNSTTDMKIILKGHQEHQDHHVWTGRL